jgi:effector-binding domain-containing protein
MPRLAVLSLVAALALAVGPALAQAPSAPPAPPAATAPPPAAAVPAQPGVSGPTELVLQSRAVISLAGESTWDDGFDNLNTAFTQLRDEAKKRGLAISGRPQALFLSTDDNGFRFEAMLTVPAATALQTAPGNQPQIKLTPDGRALLFTHVGAYDEIDTTYEAITAYLDEKGLVARNMFIEEYLNDPQNSEDVSLQMNIYVLIN